MPPALASSTGDQSLPVRRPLFLKHLDTLTNKRASKVVTLTEKDKISAIDNLVSVLPDIESVESHEFFTELHLPYATTDDITTTSHDILMAKLRKHVGINNSDYLVKQFTNAISVDNIKKTIGFKMYPDALVVASIIITDCLPSMKITHTKSLVDEHNKLSASSDEHRDKLRLFATDTLKITESRFLLGVAQGLITYFAVTMARKNATYHFALGNVPSEYASEQKLAEKLRAITTDNETRAYTHLMIEIPSLASIKKCYPAEFQTLDCVLLSTMHNRLMNSTITDAAETYGKILTSMLPVEKPIIYRTGNYKFAHALATQFPLCMEAVATKFTFKVEFGQPEKLSQLVSIVEAAEKLKHTYNTSMHIAVPLDRIIKYVGAILNNYDQLLILYHPGHPAFTVSGVSPKDILKAEVKLLAILGRTLRSSSGNNEDSVYGEDNTSSWLQKPMFKSVPEDFVYEKSLQTALRTLLSTDSKAVETVIGQSVSSGSDFANYAITQLKIEHLRSTAQTLTESTGQMVTNEDVYGQAQLTKSYLL